MSTSSTSSHPPLRQTTTRLIDVKAASKLAADAKTHHSFLTTISEAIKCTPPRIEKLDKEEIKAKLIVLKGELSEKREQARNLNLEISKKMQQIHKLECNSKGYEPEQMLFIFMT